MALQIEITTSSEFFSQAKAEWIDLLQRSSSQPFFMHPAYQESWCATIGGGALSIITVRDKGELIGLLPLYEEKPGLLRVVGAVEVSDYLDLLVDKGREKEVHTALAEFLLHQFPQTTIKLESVPHTSSTLTRFKAAAEVAGWRVSQTQQTVCPVITLPKTYEKYLQNLDSKQTKQFVRTQRALPEEGEVSYAVAETPPAMTEAITTFIALHKASSRDKGAFWTKNREQFFHQMAQNLAAYNLIKIYTLSLDNIPAASVILFDYQNQFLGYNSGFDAYRFGHTGVSNVLFLHVIEEAIKLGRSRFDFLRGEESYKFKYGAVAEPIFDLTLQPLAQK